MHKLINIIVSLTLLGIAVYILDWSAITESLHKLDMTVLVQALLICSLQYLFLGARWHMLVQKIVPLTWYQHMRRYLVGSFANTFTPANIGGDIYRVVALRKHTRKPVKLILALLRERVIGLMSFFFMYIACYTLYLVTDQTDGDTSSPLLYFLLLSVSGFFLALFSPTLAGLILKLKIFSQFAKIRATIEHLRSLFIFGNGIEFTALMASSAAAFLLWIIPIMMIGDHMGMDLAIYEVGMIAAMVELIRLAPVTVQGIGLREGAFAYFVTLFGEQAEVGFTMGAIVYLILSVSIVLSGIIGFLMSFSAADEIETGA